MRRALLAAALLLAAAPLAAQEVFPTDTALDAAHAVQRDAFLELRDSTSTISAAAGRLMSAMSPSASLPWLQARARGVALSCERSVGPLARARTVVAKASWPKAYQQKAQAEMLKAMTAFSPQLNQCVGEWKAMAADTSRTHIRETAPHTMSLLQAQVVEFDQASQNYLQFISVKLPLPVVLPGPQTK